MPTSDSNPAQGEARSPASAVAARTVDDESIWLDGDVLSCACPDCRAPMSIRLWLGLADCWRCGASIELTEQQQRQALELLQRRRQAPSTPRPVSQPTPQAAAAPVPVARLISPPNATPPSVPAQVVRPQMVAPIATPPKPRPAHVPPVPITPPIAPNVDTAHFLRQTWDGLWRDLPSWLVSAVVHMLVIIGLGLWLWDVQEKPKPLVLATGFNELNTPGDDTIVEHPTDGVEFDAPGVLDPKAVSDADAFAKSDLSLGVELEPTALIGQLSGAADMRLPAIGPNELGKVLLGRDPRVRSHLALRTGGTIESEAAVARALKWLSRHQNKDGSWSLHAFDRAGKCSCTMMGNPSDTAGTALALLPFLGAGQTHLQGEYTGNVARGLLWLMEAEGSDGDLRGDGYGRMYAHGQAAIALCEAYALTQDKKLVEPAQRAIDFIVRAQHRRGGWRYEPGQAGDTSVVGWQLMALRSAQMAYLKVPDDSFTKAAKFLDSVQTQPSIGLYTYMPGGGATDAMTAEGLLCRQYSGWKRNHSPMTGGIKWLLNQHPPRAEDANMYYWYYATQVMHHVGGSPWQEWNGQLRDLLVSMQDRVGHEAGSWRPRGNHDVMGGRLYMTALAACTLEVYYRHLPLYGTNAVEVSAVD